MVADNFTSPTFRKGRASLSNNASRYLHTHSEFDLDEDVSTLPKIATELILDRAKSIIATNQSPDIPFSQSINPYKGCEHGCIYCYARPTHAYWDLSPGLDFETRILYKPDGPKLLERELQRSNYRCSPIAFGTNTDPYQPVDKSLGITRELLLVLQRHRHPFTLVTKGSHILRDLDILEDMALHNLCSVMISVTTLDNALKIKLEPRAVSPAGRLKIIESLAASRVPVGVMMAPVIPRINDVEIESILKASAEAGATSAGYVFLRLPGEVKELFKEWLEQHYPDRARHVFSLISQSRQGKAYQHEYGLRMRGSGVFADLVKQRFVSACKRYGLNQQRQTGLDCSQFVPDIYNQQLSLFAPD